MKKQEIAALSDTEWRSYIEPLLSLGSYWAPQLADAHDPQLRRELYRGIFSQIVSAHFGVLFANPQYPDFWPFTTPATAYAGACPDHDYYITPVDDKGVYKISGFRGTVKRVDLQIGTGSFFSRGVLDENKMGLTLANYDFDDLEIGPDGYLEVIISPTRPAGYNGSWWALGPKASYFLLRQTSYDWHNEIDGRFAIERVDNPAAKPRPSAAELEVNLKQVAKWTEGWFAGSMNFVKGLYRDQGVNKMAYKDLREYGELLTQKYAYGGFDLASDEALLIEVELPEKCRYWSMHLLDDTGFTLDWINRQTHLNGHYAVIDPDRMLRVVISAKDPGIPNWLDNMGHRVGAIQARWEGCNRYPAHQATKIKVANVREHLPPDTPLVSAEARDAAIRLRRKAAQMRKRW